MRMYANEFYKTSKGTFVQFISQEADLSRDPFSPVVVENNYQDMAKGMLMKCYESDPSFTRKMLRDDIRRFVDVDVEMKNNTCMVYFRKNYDDKATLDEFSLNKTDDVTRESLYRLFADNLERILLEREDGTLDQDMFYRIAEGLKIERILPAAIERTAKSFYGYCILPEFLDNGKLTDEGKEHYRANKPEDILYRFHSYFEHRYEYGLREFSEQGKLIRSMRGGYGDEFEKTALAYKTDIEPETYIGNFETIRECLDAVEKGGTLDSTLEHYDRAAENGKESISFVPEKQI